MISDRADSRRLAGRSEDRLPPRQLVESCHALDVSALTRLGIAGVGACGTAEFVWRGPGAPFRARVRVWFPLPQAAKLDVAYADPSTGRPVVEHFELTTTVPHLGGLRWWAECACGRRCRLLYVAPHRAGFRCRGCHGLAYRTQRLSPCRRGAVRARAMRDRLGWTGGDGLARRAKPKWMRWRTYDRLELRALELTVQALRAGLPADVAREIAE